MKTLMTPRTIIYALVLFLNFFSPAVAQQDSIRTEILNFPDPPGILISKGRTMLYEKLLANDTAKARQVFDYLETFENQKVIAFYPPEKWMIWLWLGKYEKTINDIVSLESAWFNTNQREQYQLPAVDALSKNLGAMTNAQYALINYRIESSDRPQAEKAFCKLLLQYVLGEEQASQQQLNKASNTFIEQYPSSPFESFIRKYIRHEVKPSNLGLGFEFFSGYGIFTGNLKENFKHNVPVGVAFDITYKKFALYLRDYIGFSKTKKEIPFSSGPWKNNAQARVFLPEASIGYIVLDNARFKLAPFAGVSSTDISPTFADKDKYPEYEDAGLRFTTTWTAGLNFDFKMAYSQSGIVAYQEDGFWMIRVRYAYNAPQFSWRYSGFNGNMHYITIGLGGFGKRLKRID